MAIHVNGEAVAPTAGDSEYLLWAEAVNQTQSEWADTDYNWPQLRKVLNTTILVSGTSIGLPSDFRKLDGFPTFEGIEFPEVRIEEANRFLPTAAFVTVDYNGNYLSAHPARTSTEAVSVRYFSRPTSLATTTSISLCPSDNYLVFGATSKILFSRDDAKYSSFDDKAQTIMQQMIGSDVHEGEQMDTRVKGRSELSGFTLGVN